MKRLALVALVAWALPAFASDYDFLTKVHLRFSELPAQSMDATMADLKSVFVRFQPVLDEGTRIVSPLKVTGSARNPIISLSVEKCEFVICKTIHLVGAVTSIEKRGSCMRNFEVDLNLSRSSEDLTNYYDRLHVSMCVMNAKGGATMDFDASLRRAPTFRKDMIQEQVLHMIGLQVKPLTKAFTEQLRRNGARPKFISILLSEEFEG